VSDRSDLVERATEAYLALAELAEDVADEWQYVTDLSQAYGRSLRALAGDPDELPPGAAAAVQEAIAEIASITEPNRAIDWLSTFPHVVALAVGGDVDEPGETADEDSWTSSEEPDEDSPFRRLLGTDR
jgi:hypothetical protein